MAMNLTSAWPYLLPLAIFTLTCWVIAIPGLVAPLQIHLQRRDVPEITTDTHLNIRDKNREAQPQKPRLGSTERTRMTTTFNANFMSDHNGRTSGKSSRKLDIESERTSTSKNLVLSNPVDEKETDFEAAVTHAYAQGIMEIRDDEDVRTDMTSQSDLSIDMNEYYTYDYDDYPMDDDDDEDEEDEEEEDEDEELDLVMEMRSKKEANNMRTEEWRSLQRLAELATISNPELGFVNLITPNPDLDITIEVVTDGDDEEEAAAEIDNRLPGDDRPKRPRPPPSPSDDRGRDSGRRKGKGRKHNQNRNNNRGNGNQKPSRHSDNTNGNTSNYYDMTLFHLIRQTGYLDGENGDSSAAGFGEWSSWSSCSTSCGGGKKERTRPCGLQCRTTERQECNKHILCSGSSITSESENEFDASDLPSTTRSNQGFVIDQRVTIDVVDEIADVIDNSDFDSCEEWMQCRSEKLVSYLSRLDDLPSCPCQFPTNNAIVDPQQGREFHWMEQDPEATRLDIYKPTATSCILSLRSYHSTSLASQQCCYNANHRLITRGQGAGTPQLITAQISQELHYKIDILPWIICKGDWTKYNRIRQPNNGRECADIPDMQTFLSQVEEARDF